MTTYELIFTEKITDDYNRNSDHLLRSYLHFGDRPETAINRVEQRVLELRAFIQSLKINPNRGTRRDDLTIGLRILSDRRRAVIAFLVDDVKNSVTVVSIFFGGEDSDVLLRDNREAT